MSLYFCWLSNLKKLLEKVLEEYQKSGGGAIKVDGQMIDEPIAEAMRLKITLGEEEKK